MGALSDITDAQSPEDLFGRDSSLKEARHRYISLASSVHPDTSSYDGKVFAKLSDLWQRAQAKFADGSYGKATLTITTKKSVWHVGSLLWHGQISSVYSATDDQGKAHLFKAPRNPSDNDLIEAEHASLVKMADTNPGSAEHSFVPTCVEKVRFDDSSGRKVGLVLEAIPQVWSLEQVMAHHTGGLDGRNIAWIFRRICGALILADEAEVAHCGIVPHHVLVNPESHDLVLWDWTASGPVGTHKIPYITRDLDKFYPPEAAAREEVQFGTDAYMAAKTMLSIADSTLPRQMEAWFKGVSLTNLSHRPPDPVELLGEFDMLIAQLWGKRRYVTFSM